MCKAQVIAIAKIHNACKTGKLAQIAQMTTLDSAADFAQQEALKQRTLASSSFQHMEGVCGGERCTNQVIVALSETRRASPSTLLLTLNAVHQKMQLSL